MRDPERILLLSGTAEGRLIETHINKSTPHTAVTSVAGVTDLVSDITGGFGGLNGLQEALNNHQISLIVDATHPYATTMSQTAAVAAKEASLPLLRVQRPPWLQSTADTWFEVPDVEAAAEKLKTLKVRAALVALGARHVDPFRNLDTRVVFRTALPLKDPKGVINIIDKGPFSIKDEESLCLAHNISCIVCKNSGGPWSWPKLEVARGYGWPVIMIQRPEVEYLYGTDLTLEALLEQL